MWLVASTGVKPPSHASQWVERGAMFMFSAQPLTCGGRWGQRLKIQGEKKVWSRVDGLILVPLEGFRGGGYE